MSEPDELWEWAHVGVVCVAFPSGYFSYVSFGLQH